MMITFLKSYRYAHIKRNELIAYLNIDLILLFALMLSEMLIYKC